METTLVIKNPHILVRVLSFQLPIFSTFIRLRSFELWRDKKDKESKTCLRQTSPKSKDPKLQELLAADKHPEGAAKPDATRLVVVATQPQNVVVASDTEHAEATIEVRDRIHPNENPLVVGLILVLLSQIGTDLGGTLVKSKTSGSCEYFCNRCIIFARDLLGCEKDKMDGLLGLAK